MRFWRYLSYGLLAALMLVLFNFASRPTTAQDWEATPEAPMTDVSPALTLVWQSKFTPDTALFSPGDIAIDSKGNVYVSTQGGNSIIKFDKDGAFVKKWGDSGKGNGKFNLSLGMAIDAEDNVYVTDFYNHVIQKFDSDGQFLMQWDNEKSTSPAFIGLDGQGNIYVNEFPPHDDHYIQKFDTWGKLVSEWSGKSGEFGGRIEDIAVDKDGNVFVADPFTNSIKKMDTNGKLVAKFGGEASKKGNGLFFAPFGVTVDKDGYVYALDSVFLQKLDMEGKCVAQWSTVGGDLDKASNVAVDAEGNVYVFAKADVVGANGNTANVFLLKKFSQSEAGW